MSKQLELAPVENGKLSPVAKQENELVTISPIQKEILSRLQKFQKQLDKAPTSNEVVKERMGGQEFWHLPISNIEHKLKKFFFGLYKIEVIHYGIIVNEVTVHTRIYVFHPILGQWLTCDGLGSVPVQQDKDSKVADFIQTKKTKALTLNLPAAYALSVKNAAKKLGKIFGGDLNRKYEDVYTEFPIDTTPLNE